MCQDSDQDNHNSLATAVPDLVPSCGVPVVPLGVKLGLLLFLDAPSVFWQHQRETGPSAICWS